MSSFSEPCLPFGSHLLSSQAGAMELLSRGSGVMSCGSAGCSPYALPGECTEPLRYENRVKAYSLTGSVTGNYGPVPASGLTLEKGLMYRPEDYIDGTIYDTDSVMLPILPDELVAPLPSITQTARWEEQVSLEPAQCKFARWVDGNPLLAIGVLAVAVFAIGGKKK